MLINFVIGGIIKFASKPARIAKWVLSRPFQSQFTEALYEWCGLLPATSSPNKCWRPREIRKSNQMVATVVDVIKKQFLNHFDEELQKDSLYNIVSGMPVDNSICKCLTSIFSCGPALMNDFVQRLHKDGSSKSLTDTIKRFSLKTLKKNHLKERYRGLEIKRKFASKGIS